MSPYKARANDLGIGVADIARTCGAIITLSLEESSGILEESLELIEL